ncbi:MAG: response regulator [Saprospiraceae bacterium]
MIKIAITDDRREIRENLNRIFQIFEEVEVVFLANDGEVAVKLMRTNPEKPEVILMDIEMRKMNGIEATRQIKAMFPEVKIIMLSIFEQDDKIFEAIKAGADGYLLKDERPKKIIEAIQNAKEGRMAMSPLVAMKTLDFLRNTPEPKKLKTPQDYKLTPREIEILNHLSKGKSYKKIAAELFTSPHTVRSHIENIYKKLEVRSKVAASNVALENKWF